MNHPHPCAVAQGCVNAWQYLTTRLEKSSASKIVLINGPFGIGKTTTAHHVVQRLEDSMF
jgi:Cdc6-like AAA superfamily ATPase